MPNKPRNTFLSLKKRNLSNSVGIPKESKYRNIKVKVDGMKFDSKREAKRYLDLKQMQSLGLISNLRCQVKFKFEVNGKPLKCLAKGSKQLTYTADFLYIKDGIEIVEDVKGFQTKEFKIKKALFETIYNKEIKLT